MTYQMLVATQTSTLANFETVDPSDAGEAKRWELEHGFTLDEDHDDNYGDAGDEFSFGVSAG